MVPGIGVAVSDRHCSNYRLYRELAEYTREGRCRQVRRELGPQDWDLRGVHGDAYLPLGV